MRIMVDASAITRNKAGVGIYAMYLLREMIRQLNGDQLFILAQDDDPDLDYSAYRGVTMIRVPAQWFRKLPFRFMLEQVGIPFLARKHRIQVVHSLHYSIPLAAIGFKRVVTFHDMTFFDMPEMHLRFKVIYFRFFMRCAVRLADAILFVSHSAKADCLARFHKLHGIGTVIHHGCDETCAQQIAPAQTEAVRRKYDLPEKFVLYVGTIEPRKNLCRLVHAFASAVQGDAEIALVLAGAKGWMYEQLMWDIATLGLSERVRFLGFIPEIDKAPLISAATVFAYPSLYEGFGLPVLEALALGVPTVTSNISAIPEIAGKAALLVDPVNTQELAVALRLLLSDTVLREKLRKASRKQAAQFTWQAAASKTYAIYKTVLSAQADGLSDAAPVATAARKAS